MPGSPSQPRFMTSAADVTSASGSDRGRRLSPVDGAFLRLESAQSHMHVGFSGVFAAPSGRPRPSVEALRERAAGRLHEVPWCRWRLDPAPLGLSEPRWIDDVRFDLAAHIVALTQPEDRVSYASFEALRSTVLSAPLDRSRPLWQIFLVPRLEDGRVGAVGGGGRRGGGGGGGAPEPAGDGRECRARRQARPGRGRRGGPVAGAAEC